MIILRYHIKKIATLISSEEDDYMELIAAILNEIARHLSRISELCTETAGIINGEVTEKEDVQRMIENQSHIES